MRDILDYLDALNAEEERRERRKKYNDDPDTWDRQWEEMKEEEILNERETKKGI